MSLCYYFSTENIEEITLKLKHEKDGKQAGEVVVGVSGLRVGQTSGSSTSEPQAQQQHNEPATRDLFNAMGPSPSSNDSSTPIHSNSGSHTPKQNPLVQQQPPANPNQPRPQQQSNPIPPEMMLPPGTSEN